jgi:phage gpG-like protein
MKFSLKGDFPALARFEDRLRTTPKVLEVVARNMGETAVDLVREGFDTHTDPYGKPWAPLALRDGEPLADTGRLKNSFHAVVSRRGFRVAPSVTYAAFHQTGTGIYGPRGMPIVPLNKKALRLGKTGIFAKSVKGAPARKMVPDSGKLPDSWRLALNEAALEVLEDHFS